MTAFILGCIAGALAATFLLEHLFPETETASDRTYRWGSHDDSTWTATTPAT